MPLPPSASAPELGEGLDSLAMPLAAVSSSRGLESSDGSSLADFQPSPKFSGARAGMIFKLGEKGQGYYKDLGPRLSAKPLTDGKAQGGTVLPSLASKDQAAGWLPMKTVAQLRRDQGIGAPRETDSLYKKIERAPRKFNPLKIPLSLQAALPFKTKPKLEPKQKRKTLDQKRAVVLEPHERKAYTLVQQLNAIRNEKARKRNESSDRRRKERTKRQAKDNERRADASKEERKKRYVAEGKEQKRKEMKDAGVGGKFSKRKKQKLD